MDRDETIQTLKEELAEISIERDSLTLELADLRKENEDLRNRLQTSYSKEVQSEFFDDLRHQLDILTEENGILSCQTRLLREELSSLKSANLSLSRSLDSLSTTQTDNEKLRLDIAQLSRDLESWTSLSSDPATLKSELSTRLSIRDSDELRAQIQTMETSLANATELQAKNHELRTSLQFKTDENSKLTLQLQEVELLIQNQGKAADEYVQVKAENEKMTAQLRIWRDKVREVFQQNGDLIAQLQSSQEKDQRSTAFEIENIRLTNQLQSVTETLQLKEGQLTEFRALLNDSEKKTSLLLSKLSIITDENRRLNDMNEELVGTLEKQLDLQAIEGDGEASAAQSKLALLEELNAELQKTLRNYNAETERLSLLEVQLHEREAELAQARLENSELNDLCELSAYQIASVQNAVSDIHKTLGILTAEKEALANAGEAMKSTIEGMEQENEALRNKIEELESIDAVPFFDDSDELAQENRALQQQLRALKRDTANVTSYRSRVDSLSREVERLRARLEEPGEPIGIECENDEEGKPQTVVEEPLEIDPEFAEISEIDQSGPELAEARQTAEVVSRLLTDELANNARLTGQLEEAEKEKGQLAVKTDELVADGIKLRARIEELLRENEEQRERIRQFEAAGDVYANHLTALNRILTG